MILNLRLEIRKIIIKIFIFLQQLQELMEMDKYLNRKKIIFLSEVVGLSVNHLNAQKQIRFSPLNLDIILQNFSKVHSPRIAKITKTQMSAI